MVPYHTNTISLPMGCFHANICYLGWYRKSQIILFRCSTDSMACAKIKRTKYIRNINDNAVQGRLSENYLTRKTRNIRDLRYCILLYSHSHQQGQEDQSMSFTWTALPRGTGDIRFGCVDNYTQADDPVHES